MARLLEPSLFLIVPIQDARKLTGLDADELEAASQVQRLTRVSADGKREGLCVSRAPCCSKPRPKPKQKPKPPLALPAGNANPIALRRRDEHLHRHGAVVQRRHLAGAEGRERAVRVHSAPRGGRIPWRPRRP